MCRRLIAVVVGAVAVCGIASAQPGYPGGYGGLGAYGGYGWGSGYGIGGPGFGMTGGYGYNFNAGAYGPYSNTGPYAPNQFNRSSQPLSPYLNQSRGNPAVNYYFRTRPGTVGGGAGSNGPMGMAMGGNRPPFFPQSLDADPLAEPDQPGRVLPPAGHPVVFQNTLGYFPSQPGMGRTRPGTFGVGSPGQGRPPKR